MTREDQDGLRPEPETASRLDSNAFLDLAAELGCVGVEPRNDLGRPLFDGLPPARAAAMARERGLRLLGLSEVYPFDDWNADRRAAIAALIEAADAAGAETVSLIPRVDFRHPDADARARNLRMVVAEIAPMLAGKSVTALLEPIGFAKCSMKFQREAVGAIDALGVRDRRADASRTDRLPVLQLTWTPREAAPRIRSPRSIGRSCQLDG